MSVIIPAIDLRDGRCVRLVQGRLDEETVYSDDPVAVARTFAAAGAQRIHVVDLDGAFDGLPRNLEAAQAIARAVDVPVQLGGGIRDLAAIERVLESGMRWVILGTVAIEQPELVDEACHRYPGRVLVGIDARDGRVAVRGWTEGTEQDAVALARDMGRRGVDEIIFTDIAKDGMLQGPNVEALRMMARDSGLRVIASGGVTNVKDVASVAAIDGVSGIIIGKALYEGTLQLDAALAAAEQGGPGSASGPASASGAPVGSQTVSGSTGRTPRIVVCLDVRDGRVVKGAQFADVRDVGDPEQLAVFYEREGADELTVLDIAARPDRRDAMLALVGRIKQRLTIPLTIGGGIQSVAHMRQLVAAGADKLSISSAAVQRPELIAEGAEACGRERIVVAVDCRRRSGNDAADGWEVIIHGGSTPTGLDVLEWAVRAEALGAGEIVLNSIDADGMQSGYDNDLNRAVAERVTIPIVASGGVGTLEHLRDGFLAGGADAVLAASIFHFQKASIAQAKQFLHAAGVPVRLERRAMHDGTV